VMTPCRGKEELEIERGDWAKPGRVSFYLPSDENQGYHWHKKDVPGRLEKCVPLLEDQLDKGND
jgi:hypothetical protein